MIAVTVRREKQIASTISGLSRNLRYELTAISTNEGRGIDICIYSLAQQSEAFDGFGLLVVFCSPRQRPQNRK
jgi:hypothetical protein